MQRRGKVVNSSMELSPVSGQVQAAGGPASAVDQSLDAIQRAFEQWDATTMQRAKRNRRIGLVAAVAEPLAVVPLIVQVVLLRDGGFLAGALIALELVILVTLLIIAAANVGPRQDPWMRGRIRTELLRRERFLALARVGPYLRSDDPRAVVEERLALINDEVTEPDSLILPENEEGKSWRSELEEAGPGATAPLDPRALDEFAAKRLLGQEHWYITKSHENEHHSHVQEAAIRIALVLAVVLAAMHLTGLMSGGGGQAAPTHATQEYPGSDAVHPIGFVAVLQAQASTAAGQPNHTLMLGIELVALILPTVSAAAFAIQTFLESRRLARTYDRQARRLQRLSSLLAGLRLLPPSDERDQGVKRLVLETEGILAEELLQWWLHAYR
jgi:hypothetical protein